MGQDGLSQGSLHFQAWRCFPITYMSGIYTRYYEPISIFLVDHFKFPASGLAMVAGAVRSPPRRDVPSFLSRTGFSILTARRFSSNAADSRSRAFRYVVDLAKVPRTRRVRVCLIPWLLNPRDWFQ